MKATLKTLCLYLGLMLFSTTAVLAEEQEALATFKAMKPALALQLAQATLDACRKAGYQVSVAVVDRAGILQVILRDQLAGSHTLEIARRKAWTAASFRTPTTVMAEATQAGKELSGIRFASETIMVAGGIPVTAAGTLVGAVGVSGAPGGELDHQCAQTGLDAIEDALMF